MLQTLLDNSISIIFLVTITILGISEYRRYLKEQNIDHKEFRSIVRKRFNQIGDELLKSLIASSLIAFIVSMVSFRELWLTDVFHVVFLTTLLHHRIVGLLKRLTLK